jgi:putative PIN family toxin of toxin-antitoxin system
MRVVVDANVLVSAALKRQSMPGMAALLVERRGGLLKSLATEQQLFEVVARPRLASLIDPETQDWLRRLMAAAELVTITERIVACRDATDDKFLELAVNGHADLIVTGDVDLLALWRTCVLSHSLNTV